MAADLTLLRTQLAQAQAAYHQLQIGSVVTVFVDQNGERIQYQNGNKADLYAYIMRLQAQIDCGGVAPVFRPLNFTF